VSGFVQIIEFTSTRIDEIRAMMDEREEGGALADSLVLRGVTAADRDRPNTYMSIIEFESYEAAMENSARPETSEMASSFAELCDGPPRFHNLDVIGGSDR
jgi:hypothetical protein